MGSSPCSSPDSTPAQYACTTRPQVTSTQHLQLCTSRQWTQSTQIHCMNALHKPRCRASALLRPCSAGAPLSAPLVPGRPIQHPHDAYYSNRGIFIAGWRGFGRAWHFRSGKVACVGGKLTSGSSPAVPLTLQYREQHCT